MNLKEEEYNEYSFGKYIRKRREELGYSIRELSRMLGISPVYLSDIERGNRKAISVTKNGRDYIQDFIKYLQIPKEDIELVQEMVAESRGCDRELKEYIDNNKYARKALNLAKKINLSNEEWIKIIFHLTEIKHTKNM